ncbi:2-dehydropantoate 2-reductase [Variovorax sp. OV329]|uniref:2-dehydropantoate 2-reductase n=1 Tax=Variovorax sp. OV329 TaxID=1882825 RepID=UPI0008E1EE7C|nr:2-dehydropantoate 2-reductase [Variovorax sp. OV329]SFM86890.1 ketopantoate reductase [Variovorax sp. OV329]
MKIAVIGAGAIGGLVGARLALAGEDVTFLVRGKNLSAIRENGFKLVAADGSEEVARLKATDRYAEAGAQDLVILAMKAHQVEAVLPELHHLMGPDTVVLPMQNGIPFWYFHRHGGALEGTPVRSVDPEGTVSRSIDARRILGCVVYPASELVAPGVVHHIEGDRFPLGEIDGSATSERVQRVSEAFTRAGFKSPVLEDIRSEIWLKLWGNLSFNPISALSHATLVDICRYPLSRELAANMMREAQAVATRLNITFRVPLEKRIAGAEKVGKHKTSMLQDVEAGRAPEIDALVGSVAELARLTETPTPHIDTVYALVKLLARGMEEAGAGVRMQAAA